MEQDAFQETSSGSTQRSPKTQPTYSRQQLQAMIDRLPRVSLAFLPTPLHACPRFSQVLGGPQIFIKRDDLTGLAFGGNKTRQLEYLMADALAAGADTIVTGAYTISNFCRQASAAAASLGLDIALVLARGVKGEELQGNLLLDHLLGAQVTIVDVADTYELQARLEEKAEALRRQGRRPYIINVLGQSGPLAAVGYVRAFLELEEQLQALGVTRPVTLYVSAANVTQAGLELARKALGSPVRIIGVSPVRWREDRPTDIARIASETARLLGLDVHLEPGEIFNDDRQVGEGYAMVTPGGREAIQLLARTEGIILDPVYTAKAMASLIERVRSGEHARDEVLIFLHTGGTPLVFSYAEDIVKKQ